MEKSYEELREMARREKILKGFKSTLVSKPTQNGPNKIKDTLAELERLLREGKMNQESFESFKSCANRNPDMVITWYWQGVRCTEEEYYELEKRYQELTIKETGKADTM